LEFAWTPLTPSNGVYKNSRQWLLNINNVTNCWAWVARRNKQHARVHVRWFKQLYSLTTKVEWTRIVGQRHYAVRCAGANNDNRTFGSYRRVAVASRAAGDVMYCKYIGSEMHVRFVAQPQRGAQTRNNGLCWVCCA
jgi:hypothetical protein